MQLAQMLEAKAASDSRTSSTLSRLASFPSLLAIGLVAQLIVLLPVAQTALWDDDSANAYTSGYLRWLHLSWWSLFRAANSSQIQTFGRPIPLGVAQTYGTFTIIHDRLLYKILLIALTLISSALFGLLVRRLGTSAPAAALVSALPAVCWQLHLLHDPLVSYVGLMQAMLIYVSLGGLMLRRWLIAGGWWRAAVVALLMAAACLTYEAGYLLSLALIFVAWQVRRCSLRRAVVLAWPGLTVSAIFVLIATILSLGLPSQSGYHASLSPSAIGIAWGKVITSGLPLIGWAQTSGPRSLAGADWTVPVVQGVLVGGLLLVILLAAVRARGTPTSGADRRMIVALLAIAGVMCLTPALLTAVAPRYQAQLLWGWGYLPMFFSVVGWAVVGTAAIIAWLQRPGRATTAATAAAVALAVLCGAAVAVDSQENYRVVDYMRPVTSERTLVESSLSRGILAGVPDFATVLWWSPDILTPAGPWQPGYFDLEPWAREFVNRPLTMRLTGPTVLTATVCLDSAGSPASCSLLRTPTYWLRAASHGSTGFVAVARVGVRRWAPKEDTLAAPTLVGSRPVVYIRDPGLSATGPLGGFVVTVARTPAAPPSQIPAAQLHPIRRGSGWLLASLPPQASFDAVSIRVQFIT